MRTVKVKCVECGHIREIKFKNIRLKKDEDSDGYKIDFEGITYEGYRTVGYVGAVCPNKKCLRYDNKANFTIPEDEKSKLVAVLV